jgi:hypothetical protein
MVVESTSLREPNPLLVLGVIREVGTGEVFPPPKFVSNAFPERARSSHSPNFVY